MYKTHTHHIKTHMMIKKKKMKNEKNNNWNINPIPINGHGSRNRY